MSRSNVHSGLTSIEQTCAGVHEAMLLSIHANVKLYKPSILSIGRPAVMSYTPEARCRPSNLLVSGFSWPAICIWLHVSRYPDHCCLGCFKSPTQAIQGEVFIRNAFHVRNGCQLQATPLSFPVCLHPVAVILIAQRIGIICSKCFKSKSLIQQLGRRIMPQ